MNYLKISFVIFITLAITRFIPHPPNFTSLIALSFYVPAILGLRYLPAVIISFAITDIYFGFHNNLAFTWGSIFIIGLLSNQFNKNIIWRISGALGGATLFFVITNFGVWTGGMYGYSLNGLITCYILAIPFFAYNLISTFAYSILIETLYKLNTNKNIFNLGLKKKN